MDASSALGTVLPEGDVSLSTALPLSQSNGLQSHGVNWDISESTTVSRVMLLMVVTQATDLTRLGLWDILKCSLTGIGGQW